MHLLDKDTYFEFIYFINIHYAMDGFWTSSGLDSMLLYKFRDSGMQNAEAAKYFSCNSHVPSFDPRIILGLSYFFLVFLGFIY